MGAMKLNSIEASLLRVSRRLSKGPDYVIDVLLRHHLTINFTGHIHTRRPITRHITLRHRARLPNRAHMPQLRCYLSTRLMHRINYLLPSGKPLLTVKIRYARIAASTDMSYAGTLSNNKSNAALSPSAVILNHIVFGDIVVGRKISGHRSHNYAIFERHITKFEGLK